jgi:hypothetical protein
MGKKRIKVLKRVDETYWEYMKRRDAIDPRKKQPKNTSNKDSFKNQK